ncbi:MAG TPA: adenosine deaminase [Thermomicrobiales bacterium]|nr:adenosine deaminase [Thermomicrobiales bacterium]
MREPTALARFIERMPKVELHIHLEGSIRPATLLALSQRNGVPLPAADEAGLTEFFRFRDFPHFIDVYIACSDCLRQPDDFATIAAELGEQAAGQNIRYLEVHVNPEPHVRKRGLTVAGLVDGLTRGREIARERHGVEMRWIADGVRDAEIGYGSVSTTVEWIAALPPAAGVIGLGLGGNEVGNPPARFTDAFAAARAAGLHVVAHAGETTGPATIWDSLCLLGAERIGHGIRAIDDPALVAQLAARQIPLEVCPISNLRTRVVADYAAHPFKRLDDAGVLLTVNSDDPALFGATLTDEYRFLAATFDYGPDDLERFARNGIRASFLPDAEKARLLADFARENAALRRELDL